jgi:ATP-binding cassette subfamily F protein 3
VDTGSREENASKESPIERIVLKNLNLSISDDDRIGLLGQNGNGKSTLVKLIAGRLEALSGTVTRHPKLEVAYFAQHQLDELSETDTPYLLVRRKMPQAGEAQVRARAAQLGFGADKSDTQIAKLSGGEKARLLMGLAAFDGPHLLILDEPTNHLDIPMREALVEALAEYKGAVLIVSHDRAILDASCDRLWLVAEGGVKPFDGDMDDYEALVMSSRASKDDEPRETPKSNAGERAERAQKRANLKPLQEKAKSLEQQLEKFNTLLARADEALASPDIFTKAPERAAQIAKDRAALAERIASVEEEWLELMSEIEGA